MIVKLNFAQVHTVDMLSSLKFYQIVIVFLYEKKKENKTFLPYVIFSPRSRVFDWISIMITRSCNEHPPHTPLLYEPRRQKTGLRGFRPGPTQTGRRNY